MVVVVGTLHEYQRHQDTVSELEEVRAAFDQRLREVIAERGITAIGEEAGDDTAIWEHLKQEEELFGQFVAAAGGGIEIEGAIVGGPVPTVANQIAAESSDQIAHVDIRVDANQFPFVAQRDEQMAMRVMQMSATAENILVIVGEAHREGVTTLLTDAGLCVVESFSFPDGIVVQ
jgi:pheromone shutdown protein TraB